MTAKNAICLWYEDTALSWQIPAAANFKQRLLTLTALLLLASSFPILACEQEVVFSEHLKVDSASNYFLVDIQRAHGDNLVGTISRSFGGALVSGQTVSIQLTAQNELADAICAMEFAVGQTYLLKARVTGGAFQISRFNSHNIPADHERFQTYVQDIESAQNLANKRE